MFEPSKEMGAFMAHVMYEELEKIAKYRATLPGGTVLRDIDRRLAEIARMEHSGWWGRTVFNRAGNADSRARMALLDDIKAELHGAQTIASRQAKAELGSGFDRSKANIGSDATREIRKLIERTELMQKGMDSGKGGPLPKRVLEEFERDPAAIKPKIKKEPKKDAPGLYGRVRNTVGNVGIGAGLLGGGVLAYNKATDPGMPSY
tara:strand:- start:100 stop:714 length:615 start_codon:yes stop_codon:yes gene_type:complete